MRDDERQLRRAADNELRNKARFAHVMANQ